MLRLARLIVMLAILVTGVALSAASLEGALADFTATSANTGNTFTTGTIGISSAAAPTALPMTLSAMKPGDSIVRNVTISNTGSLDATYTLATSATTSSVLDTDATNGLQLLVKRCDSGFTTCGTTVYSGAIVTTAVSMGVTLAGSSGKDYLQLTVSLPSSAGNSFQNKSSTISFTWTATQTAGTQTGP
jgi:hypothetical protein